MDRRHSDAGSTDPDGKLEQRPWDLVLVAAAALILIAVARVHTFIPQLDAIRPGLVVAVVALLALALKHGGARSPLRLRSPLGYLMAFVFAWAALGVPFGIYAGNSASFLLENFLRVGVVALVIAASVRNVMDLERLLRVYAIGAIIFSVGAAGTDGFRDIRAGGYDPNDSAMFIVAAIPLVLHFLIHSPGLARRLFYGFGLLACGSAVVLSGSRGGFLALIAVLGYCLFFFRNIRPAMRVGVVVAVLAIISVQATGEFWERMETIFDEDDYNRHSITGRFEIWSRGMGYMAGRPLFGVGISNFPVAEGRHPLIQERIRRGIGTRYSAAHSIWVQSGAELGIPGLLAFLGIFGVAVHMLWRQARRRPPPRGDPDLTRLSQLAVPLIGMLIGMAVAGTFLSHAYTGLLWCGFGLVLGYWKILEIHRHKTAWHVAEGATRRAAAGPGPAVWGASAHPGHAWHSAPTARPSETPRPWPERPLPLPRAPKRRAPR